MDQEVKLQLTGEAILRSLSEHTIGATFREVYFEQEMFNKFIRSQHPEREDDINFWAKEYILGGISEFDEVLREINWKIHRSEDNNIIRSNLAYELADITKYVLSLWNLFGFKPLEILELVRDKSKLLDLTIAKDQSPLPPGKVIICDIDGVIADWRKPFIDWVYETAGYSFPIPSLYQDHLYLDLGAEISYPLYRSLKELFEEIGGYRHAVPIYPAIHSLIRQQAAGVYVAIFTSRPGKRYKNIPMDTYRWLIRHNLHPDELWVGEGDRILRASQFRDAGSEEVIIWDDDPTTILRASQSGFKVFAPVYDYNEEVVWGKNVYPVFSEEWDNVPWERPHPSYLQGRQNVTA